MDWDKILDCRWTTLFVFSKKKKVLTFKNFHLHQQFQKVKKIDAMKQESFLITDDALILQLGHLEIDGK